MEESPSLNTQTGTSTLERVEILSDRRRIRRKLTFWRIASIFCLVVALFIVGLKFRSDEKQIARVSLSGVITSEHKLEALLEKIGSANQVRGVIISINSPGGTATGSEGLFRSIQALSAKKPVVTFVDGIAASGGYITALGSDYIVARETSLVGSIGVIMVYQDASVLLDKVGVKFDDIKSSPLKAEPSFYRRASPEARAAMEQVIADTFAWFKNLVARRRTLNEAELSNVADGRVFTGRQGLALKLVDKIGDEKDAVAWLHDAKGIDKNLPVRNWKVTDDTPLSMLGALAYTASLFGYDTLANNLHRANAQVEISNLDGMLTLWQPSLR